MLLPDQLLDLHKRVAKRLPVNIPHVFTRLTSRLRLFDRIVKVLVQLDVPETLGEVAEALERLGRRRLPDPLPLLRRGQYEMARRSLLLDF